MWVNLKESAAAADRYAGPAQKAPRVLHGKVAQYIPAVFKFQRHL